MALPEATVARLPCVTAEDFARFTARPHRSAGLVAGGIPTHRPRRTLPATRDLAWNVKAVVPQCGPLPVGARYEGLMTRRSPADSGGFCAQGL